MTSDRTRGPKWLTVSIVLIIAMCWIYIAVVPTPRLPIDLADGSYSNPCCSPITLRKGNMLVGRQTVAYVIEDGKQGAYVLPNYHVGVRYGRRVEVDRHAYPLMLSLDAIPPKTLTLYGENTAYNFVRINPADE